MANSEREKLWKQRVAQWKASGQSQRSFSLEHGYAVRQFGYWVRRLGKSEAMPALMPVRVAAAPAAAPAISLRSENGWTLNLPGGVPASWLAELMRAL